MDERFLCLGLEVVPIFAIIPLIIVRWPCNDESWEIKCKFMPWRKIIHFIAKLVVSPTLMKEEKSVQCAACILQTDRWNSGIQWVTENNQILLRIKSAYFGKQAKNKWYFLSFIKGICRKTSIWCFNDERLNVFPLMLATTTFVQCWTGVSSQCNRARKRNKACRLERKK